MDEENSDYSIIVCVKQLLHLPREHSNKKIWLKAHFADQTCDESPKLSMEDDGTINFNHRFKFTFEEINLASLNEFGNRPFVISIFEAPSVPKKSDLKKPRVGIAAFDILPLIRGELAFDLQVPVHLSSHTTSATDAKKPHMSLSVSTRSPINQSFSESPFNVLRIRVESMQSLPDDYINQTSDYVNIAAFKSFAQADQPVVFSESVISLPTEPVENRGKSWMLTDGIMPGEALIPGSEGISAEKKYLEEDGELQEDNDIEHRYQSEHNKPKLLWSQEWRAFLDFDSLQRMKEQISSSPLLPIEVLRLPTAENPKVKKENDYAITFHGVAFVDLFKLLQPGGEYEHDQKMYGIRFKKFLLIFKKK
ncbi:unnamed protein product [Dibothriocephalus latus]|uniref:Uncharacterized protein n=1 Tax=Dibothriocephalus latus TaxID=60516 RepID=A0A3P7QQQ5_DIBLA|nr:unnamed protein product [Dibothriocephalus latus]